MHYALLSGLLADAVALEDLHAVLQDESGVPVVRPLQRKVEQWLDKSDHAMLVQQEYARLFLLPGGVKPYESIYRGSEPLLMQEPWVEVRDFYRLLGWRLERSTLPEDHVAVELSFMAHLRCDGATTEAARFFQRHVVTWIPQLLEDIMSHRHADFYGSVADYGLAFLELEKKMHHNHSPPMDFGGRKTDS